jgi:hypothetical protein
VRLRTLFDRLPVALLVAETNPVGTEA